MPASSPTISVVIPCYNAARTLPQTLDALAKCQPAPFEIVVVDDGSTDGTAKIAESCRARVVSLEANRGAAAAKNCGAQAARGEVLLFTDSDIVVPPTLFATLADDFSEPNVGGVVGLLDEQSPDRRFASRFKNLWMNYTYARFRGKERIGLFYTSIAAMRREVFLGAGGFDENYRGASIAEDTEFGQRVWGQGIRITLDPRLKVVHLKAYSVGGVLSEDFRRARALTLMRLRKRGQPFFTSVPLFYQLAVPTIYLAAIFFLLAFVAGGAFWLGALALIAFYGLNASLLAFMSQKGGLLFMLCSAALLPVDVLVVGAGMASAFFDYVRGRRY